MITNKNETKTMTKIFHGIVNAKSVVQHALQEWNYKTCLCGCKNYHKYKKDYSWNPSTCI